MSKSVLHHDFNKGVDNGGRMVSSPDGERKWCGWISCHPEPSNQHIGYLNVAVFPHKDAVELKAPHKFGNGIIFHVRNRSTCRVRS